MEDSLAGDIRGRRTIFRVLLGILPLYRAYLIGPRPSCSPGAFLQADGTAGNGKEDYSWFVFLKGYTGAPMINWIRRVKS